MSIDIYELWELCMYSLIATLKMSVLVFELLKYIEFGNGSGVYENSSLSGKHSLKIPVLVDMNSEKISMARY